MFKTVKVQPKIGEAVCRRCGRDVYRAPSKKNPDRTVTVDQRPGPYVLEVQDDGTVLAVWAGPAGDFAYHYNAQLRCASDEEAAEASDV